MGHFLQVSDQLAFEALDSEALGVASGQAGVEALGLGLEAENGPGQRLGRPVPPGIPIPKAFGPRYVIASIVPIFLSDARNNLTNGRQCA